MHCTKNVSQQQQINHLRSNTCYFKMTDSIKCYNIFYILRVQRIMLVNGSQNNHFCRLDFLIFKDTGYWSIYGHVAKENDFYFFNCCIVAHVSMHKWIYVIDPLLSCWQYFMMKAYPKAFRMSFNHLTEVFEWDKIFLWGIWSTVLLVFVLKWTVNLLVGLINIKWRYSCFVFLAVKTTDFGSVVDLPLSYKYHYCPAFNTINYSVNSKSIEYLSPIH